MHSEEEYIRRRSTAELQGTLRSHCMGAIDIPIDTILMICQELSNRNPNKPDAKAAFRRFVEHYIK